MLRYLLDTNIVIYVIKRRPLEVLDVFNRQHGRMAISSITLAELAHAPATVEQLLAFKAGDFIELDLKQVIETKVRGVPLFDCHYGTANNRYAIKVDRLISSSDRGWLGEHDVR